MGRPDHGAAVVFRKASKSRKSLRDNPSVTEFQVELAFGHTSIGVLESDFGHLDQALTSYRQALEIQEHLARTSPDAAQHQRGMALGLHNIGYAEMQMKRFDQRSHRSTCARTIQEKLARDNPSSVVHQSELARSHHHIGELMSRMGQFDQSLESYGQADHTPSAGEGASRIT